jgi:putative transposase
MLPHLGCETLAGQYWRLGELKSFDEFLERRFPARGGGHTTDLLPAFRTKLSMISANERGSGMSKTRHTEAQIIGVLKQLEAGRKAEDVAREAGVSKHTIYAWKAKYGGMDVSQAQEAKQLRDENTKLRKLVADLSLDKEALQSVIRKNGWSS